MGSEDGNPPVSHVVVAAKVASHASFGPGIRIPTAQNTRSQRKLGKHGQVGSLEINPTTNKTQTQAAS